MYDSGDYLTKHQNIVWMGPTGCGKSGLATGFLLHAIDRGYRGYFITFAELVAELFAALADRSERKVLRRYAAYDCLVIDEIGYAEVEPSQVGLFFTLMQKRHQTKTTLDHVESGLQRMEFVPEEQPSDVRAGGSTDRYQPCVQHEELP